MLKVNPCALDWRPRPGLRVLLSNGLCSRGTESVAHAAVCRGRATADQDRRDRCAGDRAVCCQKLAPTAQLPDVGTEELRELARLRVRLQEDFASRLRQLHRAVDLGFPEFTRHVRTLESQLAATILSRYPSAASFHGASVKKLARIVYDGSHKDPGRTRSHSHRGSRKVGSYHSEPYRLRIKYLCEDLDVLRRRVKDLARDIERKLDDHEVGELLTTARFLHLHSNPFRWLQSPG